MSRRAILMTLTVVATLFVATDSVWACKFLDNLLSRSSRRACVKSCTTVPVCSVPKVCAPVSQDAVKEQAAPPSPADKAYEAPAGNPAPAPGQEVAPVPDKPADKPAEQPADKPAEQPAEKPAPTPVEQPAEKPAPVEQPAPAPIEQPAPAPVEQPATPPVEQPAATPAPAEQPAATPAPAEQPAAAPAEQPAATPAPAEQPAAAPAEQPAPAPVEKPAAPKAEDDPFAANDTNALRQWTDVSGKYQIEARFVNYVDGFARLQRADGRFVRIELTKLCAADQGFILSQVEKIATTW